MCGGNVFESKNAFICENNRRDSNECYFFLYKQDRYFTKVYEHEITKTAAMRILKNGKYTEKKKTVQIQLDQNEKRVKWVSGKYSACRKANKFDQRGADFD